MIKVRIEKVSDRIAWYHDKVGSFYNVKPCEAKGYEDCYEVVGPDHAGYAVKISDTAQIKDCPEFPYFGAPYPDATCIDGYLWDLDSGEGGMVTSGGEDPCPFCNTELYIEQNLDELNGITLEKLEKHIAFIRTKYGQDK